MNRRREGRKTLSKNSDRDDDDWTVGEVFEAGARTPVEPIFAGSEEWDSAPVLYSLPTPPGIDFNSRTAQALETWFDATVGPTAGVASWSTPGADSPLIRSYEQMRWVMAVSSFVLLLSTVVVAVGPWMLQDLMLWLFVATIGSASASWACDSKAKAVRRGQTMKTAGRDALAHGRMRIAQGTPSPPELKLALHVAQTAHVIETSPAFSSGYLSSHRRRINLAEEVAALSADAAELWNVRKTLTRKEDIPEGSDASALLGVLAAHERDLISVWDSLKARANALDRYRTKVDEMNDRLRYLDQLEAAAGHADRIVALKNRTVEHRQAAEATDSMSAELEAVREAIDSLVRGMDKDIAVLEARPADHESD